MFENIVSKESFETAKQVRVSSNKETTIYSSNLYRNEALTQSAICDILLAVLVAYTDNKQVHVNQIIALSKAYNCNAETKRVVKHYHDNKAKLSLSAITIENKHIINISDNARKSAKLQIETINQQAKLVSSSLYEFIMKNSNKQQATTRTIRRKASNKQQAQQTAQTTQNEVVNK